MNVLKWFFQICTSQDGEAESRKVHTLENGGSNPSPAINPSIVQRIKKFSIYLLSMNVELNPIALSLEQLTVTDVMECSSVVEQ